MSMGRPYTVFDVAQRGMSAQMVRMNAAASNLANAGTVAASQEEAYRPLRPVFAQDLDKATGLSTVNVREVVRENTAPTQRYDPGHPLADANGNVWISPVDENAEMVEMLEGSRQYQNIVEALTTTKQLMLDTLRLK